MRLALQPTLGRSWLVSSSSRHSQRTGQPVSPVGRWCDAEQFGSLGDFGCMSVLVRVIKMEIPVAPGHILLILPGLWL